MSERRFILFFMLGYAGLLAWSYDFSSPYFRIHEMLYDREFGRWAPSTSVEMVEYGDLGYKSGIVSLAEPRKNTFTTDEWGFRNPTFETLPDVVVVGDSFTAGVGLDDHDTLARQLQAALGRPVYNRGQIWLSAPGLYLGDARFVAAPPRVVVWCPAQRALKPSAVVPRPSRSRPDPEEDWQQRLTKGLQDLNRDEGLVRPFRSAVGELSWRAFGSDMVGDFEGEAKLRLPLALTMLNLSPEQRGLASAVETVRQFDVALRARGTTLVYCPIPDAANVYPELYTDQDRARMVSPQHVDSMVEQTRAAGVIVVDLPTLFRQHRSPYLYWRDDSHWNPRGVQLAVGALAETIRGVLDGSGAQLR